MSRHTVFSFSGIGFVAVALLAVLLGGSTPGTDEPAAEIAAFYQANELRQFITSFVLAATVPFLVVFAVALGRSSRRRGGDASPWGAVVVAGAVLAGGAILLTAAVHFALIDVAGNDTLAAGAVLALATIDGATWVAFFAGFGVMMLGAAGLLLAPEGGSRRLGWIALVLGIALFVPFADFFALLLTLVWIAVASAVMARRGEKAESTVRESAPVGA